MTNVLRIRAANKNSAEATTTTNRTAAAIRSRQQMIAASTTKKMALTILTVRSRIAETNSAILAIIDDVAEHGTSFYFLIMNRF